MATNEKPQERRVSLSISIRAGSMTQQQAQELEDKIRDICDDYAGVDVQATKGAERPQFRV